MLPSALRCIEPGNNAQAGATGKPTRKPRGKRGGGHGLNIEKHPRCQLAQKESERTSRMEAMDLRNCSKSRETVGTIPREATERKSAFLEGW